MANARKPGKRKIGMWVDSDYADVLIETAHEHGSALSTVLETLSLQWLESPYGVPRTFPPKKPTPPLKTPKDPKPH